jgi:hypothetical protein
MLSSQFIQRPQYLPYLIGFGLPVIVLDIYPGIALPRCFIDAVAAAGAFLPKVMFANSAQIAEPDVLGVVPHLINDFVQGSHTYMVSILIPYVNGF